MTVFPQDIDSFKYGNIRLPSFAIDDDSLFSPVINDNNLGINHKSFKNYTVLPNFST